MFIRILFFFSLLNFCCLPLFSENGMIDEQLEEDIQISTEEFTNENIPKKSFETVEDLKKFGNFKRWNDLEYREFELHSPRKYDSTAYRAILPSNSKVRNKKTDKIFYTKRRVFVVASAHDPYDAYADLINKDGSIKYITKITNLKNIEHDLDLYPIPKKYETYSPQPKIRSADKIIKIENFLSLSFDSMDGEYVSTFLPEDVESIKTQSLHFASYFNWRLPFQFGLAVSFQNISEYVKNNKIHSEYFFLGPAIKVPLLTFNKFEIYSDLLIQNTTTFQLQSGDTVYDFKSSSFKLDLGILIPIGTNSLTATFGYRQMRPKITNSAKDNNIITSPTTDKIEIISLAFGYNFNFIL